MSIFEFKVLFIYLLLPRINDSPTHYVQWDCLNILAELYIKELWSGAKNCELLVLLLRGCTCIDVEVNVSNVGKKTAFNIQYTTTTQCEHSTTVSLNIRLNNTEIKYNVLGRIHAEQETTDSVGLEMEIEPH